MGSKGVGPGTVGLQVDLDSDLSLVWFGVCRNSKLTHLLQDSLGALDLHCGYTLWLAAGSGREVVQIKCSAYPRAAGVTASMYLCLTRILFGLVQEGIRKR